MDSTTVFLRTETGRTEIREKKNGLTQSERLVLIMIDGVASYGEIQGKLSSLKAERFSRAIHTLQKKELISEVFLQVENQPAEKVDQEIVDRYLHQDPMDPVTIISFHPDDEFEEAELSGRTLIPVSKHPEPVKQTAEAGFVKADPATVPELNQVVAAPAIDLAHAKLADELNQELAVKNREWKRKQAELHIPKADAPHVGTRPMAKNTDFRIEPSLKASPGSAPLRVLNAHWGYWMIGLGCAFIIGFLLARVMAS